MIGKPTNARSASVGFSKSMITTALTTIKKLPVVMGTCVTTFWNC